MEPGLQPAAQLAIEAGEAGDGPPRSARGIRLVCRLGVSLGFVERAAIGIQQRSDSQA